VALAYGGYLFVLLRHFHGDWSRCAVAGGAGVDARAVPKGLTVTPNIGGYDGAGFYRLALNPFTRTRTAYGITLDDPPYRQQRILYPLIVWLLSLGHAAWVPMLLVLVNFAAVVTIAAAGAALARNVAGGVAMALYPGFLLTMSHDTSEIVACAFIVAALCMKKPWLLLSCAVLTRETTLIVAVCLLSPVPIVVYAVWQVILYIWWHALPLTSASPHWTVPFVEYARFFAAAAPMRFHLQRLWFFECVFLAIVVACVLIAWRRSPAPWKWRIAWIVYFAIAAMLPHNVWGEDVGFLRILSEFFVMSAIIVVPTRVRWALLIPTAALWLYLANHVVHFA
jgi:hypothetical protein